MKKMMKRIACVAASLAVLGCSSLAYAGQLNPTNEVVAPYGIGDLVQLEPHTWVHSGNFHSTTYLYADPDVLSMDVTISMDNYGVQTYSIQGNTGIVNLSGSVGTMQFTIVLHYSDGEATIRKSVNVFDYFCGMSHSYTSHCYDTGMGSYPSSSSTY